MDIKETLTKVPHTPGVYFFYDGTGALLYIGKAADLRKRVGSYFQKKYREPRLERMVSLIERVEYVPTSSSAEALIYESYYIKEKNPRFNIALRDDKSYPFLQLTVKDRYPKLFITREMQKDGSLYYGPYTNVRLLRQAMSLMKRIFPLRTCNVLPKKECLNYHLGQCLGPCVEPDRDVAYKEVVNDVKLFLSGRKKTLISRLEERMRKLSEELKYEDALKTRGQLEALSVVLEQREFHSPLDSALKELKDIIPLRAVPATIEAFDISNMHGKDAVGSMVSFFNAKPSKENYRRYKIRTVDMIDDYAMIKEVVRRRYSRLVNEGKKLPDLVLIDGGIGHLNAAEKELKALGLKLPVISIAKKEEAVFSGVGASASLREASHTPLPLPRNSKALRLIQYIRDEAHRFALAYHRVRRKKTMFE